MAGGAHRHRFEPLPQILRQRGAGVEDQPQLREERSRESLVAFEMRQQRGVAGRHVEIDRRRDFGEVAHGLADHRGQRTAAVDHQRAGVAQHHVEVVVAAEGVIPRQPVDQRERLLGEERPHLQRLLLVRGQHAVGVDHALGQAGRAGGEQDFRDRVGAARGGGLVDGGAGRRAREIVEQRRAEVRAVAARDDFGVAADRRERLGERRGVGHVDQAGRRAARRCA